MYGREDTAKWTVEQHMVEGFELLDTARVGQPGAERAATIATAHFAAAQAVMTLKHRAGWQADESRHQAW